MGLFSKSDQKKVLFVDDEPSMVTIMKTRLQSRSYEVLTALDGNSAIKMAQKHMPDLVILDVTMPDPNGIEVCRRLKEDERTCRIPVVMFTCAMTKTLEAECMQAGAAGVVYKPLVRDLFEMMEKAFGGGKIDLAE